jgi:hypothetical protein
MVMGEEAAVQNGFGGSHGGEEGVVGAYNGKAVGGGVYRCDVGW